MAWQKHRKRTQHKTKTQKTPSLRLFTFVVLLLVDVGVALIIILLLYSRKHLLSNAPSCPQNLKTRLTTNPSTRIAIGLTTYPLSTEIGTRYGSWNPSFLFLECLHYKFFLFFFLFFSLSSFRVVLTSEHTEATIEVVAKLPPPPPPSSLILQKL